MGKNKLVHFKENREFPNFFQPVFEELKAGYVLKGKWADSFFGNSNPLVLELGCGKGEYTTGLATKYPDKNFIGIDKKGARMWRGAKTSQVENIPNVAFIRTKAEQLGFCFDAQEVDELWITFPDPVFKKRRIDRRLSSPKFLDIYRSVMKPRGMVHIKTDNDEFYGYSLETINSQGLQIICKTDDLYQSGYRGDAASIQTFYEKKYRQEGVKIKYIQFVL